MPSAAASRRNLPHLDRKPAISKSKISERPLKPIEIARKLNRGLYADGDGLYLKVSPTGTKSWILRFMLAGTARNMGLGKFPRVGLAEARNRRREADSLINKKIDPVAERAARNTELAATVGAQKAARARMKTFLQCAEKYIATHSGTWKNEKHRAQWLSMIHETRRGKKIFPPATKEINDLPVSEIDTGNVMKVLEPIWHEKTETANRIRGRIQAILDSAKVDGYRSGENPARWEGHLKHILPSKSKIAPVEPQPALPHLEIPRFMADLRSRKGISPRALEFGILTATRVGAFLGATWDEIDLQKKLWTVPADRIGTKKTGEDNDPREVPLSDAAIAVLEQLPREAGNPLIFLGGKKGKQLSANAPNAVINRMNKDARKTGQKPYTDPNVRDREVVAHGFRSCFRDWVGETTAYADDVSDAALWHVQKDKVKAAYLRTTFLQKRARLMADWSAYCASKPGADHGNVTPIRQETA